MTAGLRNSIGAIFADVRYAIRNLAKTPTVTAAILLATAPASVSIPGSSRCSMRWPFGRCR